jgi:hypothetical protein
MLDASLPARLKGCVTRLAELEKVRESLARELLRAGEGDAGEALTTPFPCRTIGRPAA